MTLSKEKLDVLGASLIGRKAKGTSTLAEIEKLFDVELPQTYKSALVDIGGGIFFDKGARFKPDKPIPLQRPDGTLRLSMLFGLGRGKHSLLEYFNVFKEDLFDEYGLFPIGDSPGGNLVLADEEGKVLFWDHETGDLYRVSKSLDEFFDRLLPDPAD